MIEFIFLALVYFNITESGTVSNSLHSKDDATERSRLRELVRYDKKRQELRLVPNSPFSPLRLFISEGATASSQKVTAGPCVGARSISLRSRSSIQSIQPGHHSRVRGVPRKFKWPRLL